MTSPSRGFCARCGLGVEGCGGASSCTRPSVEEKLAAARARGPKCSQPGHYDGAACERYGYMCRNRPAPRPTLRSKVLAFADALQRFWNSL